MNLRAIALLACLAAQSAQAQSTVDIPNEQARVIAIRAVQAGDVQLAIEIARQLLAQDRDDRAALVVMAAAAPQVGDFEGGRRAGARAWRVSQTDAQKYEAARLTALAAAGGEQFTLSTIWLRRALTVAPDDTERARTITDARAISRRNPWATSLSFSIVPSNNVNGGADDATLTTNGAPTGGVLSDDALALSGIRASLNLRSQYRLHATENSRTVAGLQYSGARVHLTQDAPVPDAAFDSNTTEISVTYDRALPVGAISLSSTIGTADYRSAASGSQDVAFHTYDFARLSTSYRRPLSDRSELNTVARLERYTYHDASIGELNRKSLSVSYVHKLTRGDTWYTTLSYTDSTADDRNYVSDTWALQGVYSWNNPIGPITLSMGAGVSLADYPEYSLPLSVTDGREDTTIFYNINMGFADLSYAGFTPGMSINHSFAESNVSRFTRETLSVGFTLQSQF